jgi:hypothetical protein
LDVTVGDPTASELPSRVEEVPGALPAQCSKGLTPPAPKRRMNVAQFSEYCQPRERASRSGRSSPSPSSVPTGDLGPVGGDREGQDGATLGEDDPIDHHRCHVELAEVSAEHLRELGLCCCIEQRDAAASARPPADGGAWPPPPASARGGTGSTGRSRGTLGSFEPDFASAIGAQGAGAPERHPPAVDHDQPAALPLCSAVQSGSCLPLEPYISAYSRSIISAITSRPMSQGKAHYLDLAPGSEASMSQECDDAFRRIPGGALVYGVDAAEPRTGRRSTIEQQPPRGSCVQPSPTPRVRGQVPQSELAY